MKLIDIQEGDFIELKEDAGFSRGALRTFDHDGEVHRMQAKVLDVSGQLVRIQREGAYRTKWGSFPMVEWVNRSDIYGTVQPGLAVIKGKQYEQFWDS